MWFNTNTQAVYRSHAEIRAAFVNTSFPSELHDSVLLDFGVCALLPSPIPEHDPAVQIAEEGQPLQIDGLWTQQWTVRALTPEELKARVPTVVTMRQARRALLDAGLLDQVDAAIAAIADATERRQAEIDWEYATTVERLWPWVQTLGAALELSEAQLDELFEQAATL